MLYSKPKIGFIPANRGFFSDKLAAQMRADTITVLKKAGMQVVVPSEKDTKVGCVESLEEALKVGRLFRKEQVDGIVVAAVNFGDEQGVALTIRESGLKVPVLIFGCQEEEVLKPTTERRDSFCGLLSIGDVLRQLGMPYSVPEEPICFPTDAGFRQTAERFAAVVRVVTGIRKARYGQIGTRPDAFWTCRYSEKALQEVGPTIVVKDLSEVMGDMQRMKTDAEVKKIMKEFKGTIDCSAVNDGILEKIAKFELVVRNFVRESQLDGLGIQCWTSLQKNIGICSCSVMGRPDDEGIPAACESDMLGALSMHALQLASGSSSCLADWNNLHNEDPELVNCWHCGVFPPSWAKVQPKLGCQEIIAGTTGRENAMGVLEFVMKDGPVTLCRATQDNSGRHKVAILQGMSETNAATTFGAYGWIRLPGIQKFYKNVLLRNFPHHVAMNRAHVGNVLWEAFGNYLGFDVYAGDCSCGGWCPELPFKA